MQKLSRIFVVSATLSNLSGLTQILIACHVTLGIDPKIFISLDSILVAFTGRIALLPVVVLATTASFSGLEGFTFASLISLYDLGTFCSGFISTAMVC